METKNNKTIFSLLAVTIFGGILGMLLLAFNGVSADIIKKNTVYANEIDLDALIEEKNLETIYLAGGCFWGVEEYLARLAGIYDVSSGYANGTTENPTYEDVVSGNTGHAETVKVVYDPKQITLDEVLSNFFRIIDPTSLNKQGNDVGTQYRTGIYYINDDDKCIIDDSLARLQTEYDDELVVEALPLSNFYTAEEYHQDYLSQNKNGYCHVNLELATEGVFIHKEDYPDLSIEDIKATLTDLQYDVTQNNTTEEPFSSNLNDNHEVGLYVDIITGEPLFLSTDKFDSGTGWPSFTKPISSDVLVEDIKNSNSYNGVEVKSRSGLNHLGHYFTDGPKEDGGLRYCINGAALRFVPFESMVQEGYAYLQHLIIEDSSITYKIK